MLQIRSIASRRDLLGGAIAVAALAASPSLSAARSKLDLDDPQGCLRAYMLMRGALDERLTISCISCAYFGVVDGQMTPFYDLVAATFARFRKSANGGYAGVSFEIEYFIDRQTGDVIGQWRNPYSGETVTAKHVDSQPAVFRLGPDLRFESSPAVLSPGSTVERQTPVFEGVGDNVWVREKTTATVPMEGKVVRFNEQVTYHAKAGDLARSGATRVRADTQYLGVSSFRPWQAMGDRPGHVIGYGVGATDLTMDELPPRWLAATKRLHPKALIEPGAELEPLWRTL